MQWLKRPRDESAVAPSVNTILEYEKSRSCSKKKAYQALSDFVKERTYIWRLLESQDFTLEAEGDLRVLLLAMREEDRSGLYHRARNYYNMFRTGQADLERLHDKFWDGRHDILINIFKGKEPSVD